MSIVPLKRKVAPPWRGASVPKGWKISADGVFGIKEDEQFKISGPAWIDGLTRDHANGGWGRVVKWIDQDQIEHERAIPAGRFHESDTKLVQEIAYEGLLVVPGQERKLKAYLGSFDTKNRVRSVAQLGWLDSDAGVLSYVLPKMVITKSNQERVIFQPEGFAPTEKTLKLKAKGTLDEWSENVVGLCEEHDLLVFALCAGFSGALMKPSGIGGGGFHFFGLSSRGKTTLQQVAASVVGCGADPDTAPELSLIRKWNATANAFEGLAAAHNDNILLLDEIATCGARDFGAVVYNLAGGQGKSAMTASRNLKMPRAWRVMLLSTGEISSVQKIAEAGKTVKAGQTVRLVDIPTEANAILSGENAANVAESIKRACSQFYGVAGVAFIENLIAQADSVEKFHSEVRSKVDTSLDKLIVGIALSPEQRRAMRRFAVVEVAGQMAFDMGVLPISHERIKEAVLRVRDLWLNNSVAADDVERGIDNVRAFLLKHESRFRDKLAADAVIRDLAGYIDWDKKLYLFTKEGLLEACDGQDIISILKGIREQGWLFTNRSKGLLSGHRVTGIFGTLELYAINFDILDAGGDV